MKDLMEKVFETLYERDSEQLGKIIDSFGYFDKDEQEEKVYDFEEFMEKIEAIAKENNIEMEDIATRIINVCEISGNNIDEMVTKLKEIKSELEFEPELIFESFMNGIIANANLNKFPVASIAIGLVAGNYFTEDQQTNTIKEMLVDEIEDGSLEPKDIKRIMERALGRENYKKVFYEDVEERHIHHLVNEEEQGTLEKVLGEFDFYHDDRTEEEKTKEYGKLYIEQLIKDKNSEEAIKITEQLRSNQLLTDGEETVIALCETNQEQLIDTINTNLGTEELVRLLIGTVGLSKVEDEIKFYQGIKTNTLTLDLTNIRYAAETILNNEGLRKEIKRIKKERKK